MFIVRKNESNGVIFSLPEYAYKRIFFGKSEKNVYVVDENSYMENNGNYIIFNLLFSISSGIVFFSGNGEASRIFSVFLIISYLAYVIYRTMKLKYIEIPGKYLNSVDLSVNAVAHEYAGMWSSAAVTGALLIHFISYTYAHYVKMVILIAIIMTSGHFLSFVFLKHIMKK